MEQKLKHTQKQRIIKYMRDFGSINPLQALGDLGVMRLASRISDLRRDGWIINKSMKKSINRYGEKVRFAEYRLIEEGIEDAIKG